MRAPVFVWLACAGCLQSPLDHRARQTAATSASTASASNGASVSSAPPPTPPTPPTPPPPASVSAVPAVAPAPLAEPEGAPPLRRFTHVQRDRGTTGQQRMEMAEREKGAVVRSLFASAGVKWPPLQLLMRAFKKENRLEIWASGAARGPLTHVTTYEICYASGDLGPKRQEGDAQVPEGFYGIVWFKGKSDYHLAMQVSYPNTSDRVLGHPRHPGGEIMIHGACVSIGCLAMSDERIEELWVIARAAPRTNIDVHIFPTRDMAGLLATDSPHHDFWLGLREGFDRFEKTRERFGVRVQRDGRYSFYDL